MVAIQDVATYLPLYRVHVAEMRSYWTREGARPESGPGRSVCNFDEDAITMAAAAVARLGNQDHPHLLLLASTSLPYAEKLNAGILAAIQGWQDEILVLDATGSSRSAVDAFSLAANQVASRGGTSVVAAADCRTAWPGSDLEPQLADGAGAVVLGGDSGLASIEDSLGLASEFTDSWRLDGEQFLRAGDARFGLQKGYVEPMAAAVHRLLQRHRLDSSRIRWAAIAAPSDRAYRSLLKTTALPPQASLADFIRDSGDLGAPAPFFLLEEALGASNPGDLLLLGSYGSGATLVLLKVQDGVRAFKRRRPASSPARTLSYAHRLLFRRAVSTEPVTPFSSVTQSWREQAFNLPLRGRCCSRCRSIEFPVQRACRACGSLDQFETVPLSRTGAVFTCTVDHLFPSTGGPVGMAVVDLDGGGRIFVQTTDCDPREVASDMRVELVLRRLHDGGGYANYFWKARPLEVGR